MAQLFFNRLSQRSIIMVFENKNGWMEPRLNNSPKFFEGGFQGILFNIRIQQFEYLIGSRFA